MLNKKNVKITLLFLVIIVTYFFISAITSRNIFVSSWTPYYNHLINALLHGRLNIISKERFDLSFFKGQWYMYWGVPPSLFIFPFYLIWRVNASDVFYTLVSAIFNILIFYLIINEIIKYFKLRVSQFSKNIVLLSFAFASPNFYLSLAGSIWHTNQVIAILYLLLFYLFYFKFLNNLRKYWFLILAAIFLNLAWLSRNSLIFNFILFLYPLLITHKKNKKTSFKLIITISVITCLFFIFFFAYNYFRFGNIAETGIKYQNANERFAKLLSKGQYFSFNNFLYNFRFYFLNHISLSLIKPYVIIDKEGNSVFSVYPLLILLIYFHKNKILKDSKFKSLIIFVLLTVIGNLFLILSYLGTGWVQFGSRYFFDVVPLLFLLVLLIINNVPNVIKWLILLYGILINFVGVLVFFRII